MTDALTFRHKTTHPIEAPSLSGSGHSVTHKKSGVASRQERLRKVWHDELERELGLGRLDAETARKVFSDGVATLQDLEGSGQITPETSRQLLHALASLYAQVLVASLSEGVFGAHRPLVPDFTHWLLRLK